MEKISLKLGTVRKQNETEEEEVCLLTRIININVYVTTQLNWAYYNFFRKTNIHPSSFYIHRELHSVKATSQKSLYSFISLFIFLLPTALPLTHLIKVVNSFSPLSWQILTFPTTKAHIVAVHCTSLVVVLRRIEQTTNFLKRERDDINIFSAFTTISRTLILAWKILR